MKRNNQTLEKFVSKDRLLAVRGSGTDLCVSAGAGSGKTSVLIDRFMHAVTEKGIAPDRILAITFTEKAAKEMKGRLISECQRRGLHDVRRCLENAYIDTIHGFCSRMLREHPIEGRVDPSFTVLGEGESELLAEKVLGTLFEQGSGNESWISMLCDYDEKGVRAALADFYDRYRASGAQKALSKFRLDAADTEKVTRRLLSALRQLDAGFEGKKPTDAEQALRDAGRRCAGLVNRGLAGRPEWKELFFLQEEGGLPKHRAHSAAVEEVRTCLDRWVSGQAEVLAEPLKKEFRRLFLSFKNGYEQEKRKRAACDFEDLLLMAHDLLVSEAPANRKVRAHYQALFESILVDEMQDTNPLQYRIIELLRSGGNLFMVGDTQQSIYGFRHAEPEIFASFLSGNSGKMKKIMLAENFRSRKELLSFVNAFFAGRGGAFQELLPKKAFAFKKPFCVELACVVRDDKENTDLTTARVKEAATVASRLKEMVDSGFEVEGEDGHVRPLRYRDIAILFRGMTHAYLYEKELGELAIPCVVAKGRTFYSRPEVVDLLHFLKILEDPHDDIALATVLRSPMVQASDDALFWLARAAKIEDPDAPLADALKNLKKVRELSPEDRARLEEFNAFYDDLLKKKDRVPLSTVMHQILVRTCYEAKALARPDGRQRQANILKLLGMTERIEEKGVLTVKDFIGLLKNLSEHETAEPEATLPGEPEEAVLLSTIHGVKGLEFPCVVLADLGAGSRNNQRGAFLFDDQLGFGLKVKNPVSRKWVADALYRRIRETLDKKEAAEEERLLYVGMTRAKEHLILAGCLKPGEGKRSEENEPWMNTICRALAFSGGEEDLDFQGARVRMVNPTVVVPPVIPKGVKTGKADSTVLNDLKKRLRPVEKIYGETEDMTVTAMLSLGDARMAYESEKATERPVEDKAISVAANEFGTIYHRWMEAMVLKGGRLGVSFISKITEGLSVREKKEMGESVKNFWSGPWGAMLKASEKRYAELPFIYRTKRGILKGQIDLAFKTASGEWVVLDYKTHRISPEEMPKTASAYELQIGFYALVFRRLYGEAPARGVLYFSSIDRWKESRYAPGDFEKLEASLDGLFLQAAQS